MLFVVKNLRLYQSYGADTNDGSADGRTDTQNFGRYNIIHSPLFVARHKKYKGDNLNTTKLHNCEEL